jgi:uncharacterized protein (TIRG00374 family)
MQTVFSGSLSKTGLGPNQFSARRRIALVSKKFFWGAFKYVLAIGLLVYVVWSNWKDPTAEQRGEFLAAFNAAPQSGFPANLPWTYLYLTTQRGPPGLADVWQRHFVDREPIHAGYLALAFIIGTAAILLTFFRWYLLVRTLRLPFTVGNGFRLGLVGFFFNTFLPGSVGGDIVKAAFIAREQSRRTRAVATVIIDRVLALWALVWFVTLAGSCFWFAGLLRGDVEKTIVGSAAAIAIVTGLIWGLLGLLPTRRAERFANRLGRIPKVGLAAAEFWLAVWLYRKRPLMVAVAIALSLVGHVGFVFLFYFSVLTLWDPSRTTGSIPTLTQHFLIVPIGLVIQAMPLFPGGAGIGEAGFGGLYKLLGCSAASGVLGALVQRVIYWSIGLVGYVVYLRMRPALRPMAEDLSRQLAAVQAGSLVETEVIPPS